MVKEVVNLIVKGGKANAGPPIGPALAGKGIAINDVVKEINSKTAQMADMDVPVKVTIDTDSKSFEIEVGLPPVSALLLKEAELSKGSGAAGLKTVGALKIQHLIKVAKLKYEKIGGKSLKQKVLELLGTCKSLGLRVESKDPKELIKEVKEGKYDKIIEEEKTELTPEDLQKLKAERKAIAEEVSKLEAAEAAAAQATATAATAPQTAPTSAPKKEEKK